MPQGGSRIISTKIVLMQRHLVLVLKGLLLAATALGQTNTIYVYGGVNRPGAYSVDPGGVTLSAAIRQAGGLIPGAHNRADIVRVDDHGVTHKISVMLQPILDHKATDVPLKPRDRVFVLNPGRPFIDDRLRE
jgi:protein involved in polysaccharide export with SLBB domain